MKRILITTISLFALCAGAYSQEMWFCDEPGKVLSYVKTDANSGAQSTYEYVIKDKTVTDNRTTVIFDVVVPGQAVSSGCSVWAEDGWFYSDASASIGQIGNGSYAKGNSPVLPDAPYVGQVLKDCSISIETLMLTSEYRKIRFTSNSDVTVPAGTFNCWCLDYDVVDTAMGLKARSRVKQWFAKGVGEVKSETRDMNGRLISQKELVEIK